MGGWSVSDLLNGAVTVVVATAVLLLAISVGRADHAPRYAADGAVVHGDWGLYRPGHVAPWATGPQVVGASRFGLGRYFPSNRHDPGAHRRRPPVDRAPVPAEPYFRSWGAQSQGFDSGAATVQAPYEPPAVIYAPRSERRRHP